jgi:flagellar biosynthetic protein FlhB
MAEDDDRTEAPTARRLQRARDEGQVALSRELVMLAGLAAAAMLLAGLGDALGKGMAGLLAPLLAMPHALTPRAAAQLALSAALLVAAPAALATLAAAAAATFLQTRFLINTKALKPDFSRLSPARRLAQMFGAHAVLEALKSLAKLAVVALGAWLALRAATPDLPAALGWGAGALGRHVAAAMLHLLASVLIAQAVIAAADLAVARLRHLRGLRMSRTDIRDEHREAEGDPMVKRRLRQMQMQRARRRMMAAVPQATVVLTNPTHYAVALEYDRSRGGAPRVTAKGVDELAARIRELAERSGVPIVANPPLARALHRVELDAEIPAEHFRLVAEIIAYVWRLKRRLPVQA